MALFKNLKDHQQSTPKAKQRSRNSGMMGMLSTMPQEIAEHNQVAASARQQLDELHRLQKYGAPASAQVNTVRQTGQLVNHNPVAEFEMVIDLTDAGIIRTISQQPIPQSMVNRMQPGATVPVLIDLTDHSKVIIDWAHSESA